VSGAVALVFPGQGSQRVGMGKAWAERFASAAEAYREADAALGSAISTLCFEGPEETLQLTANAQPAILATSIAILRSLREMAAAPGSGLGAALAPAVLAGHSLGEYTAHVAAGTLTFAEALRLVRRRGELMQQAVPVGQGAMAAILGADDAAVARLAAAVSTADELCTVANYNAPGQAVVAGHRAAVERAVAQAREHGARKAMPLPVSAPFHCPLMRPAREAMTPVLAAAAFADPAVPVVTNIDALPVRDGGAARDALGRQIDGPVRWVESVRWMATEGGVATFVEVGGAVVTAMIKRIAPEARALAIVEPEHAEALRAAGAGI
jgi:[acyl-carrier-protein] S-malonyltransferase